MLKKGPTSIFSPHPKRSISGMEKFFKKFEKIRIEEQFSG